MAKKQGQKPEQEAMEQTQQSAPQEEMTLAEARAYRASLYKADATALNDQEKREAFRLFWAQQKSKYGKSKDMEQVIWLHLKTMKMDTPDQFENGLKHFGLQKLGN